ncbi:MAG: hypothetical protein PUH01_08085, partial [Pseudomonadota bacterium]|nr:hypothetical protein [Pseudomonadota bacterium]
CYLKVEILEIESECCLLPAACCLLPAACCLSVLKKFCVLLFIGQYFLIKILTFFNFLQSFIP